MRPKLLAILAAAVLVACGGSDTTSPHGSAGIHAVAGANASDTVAATLAQALIVEVRDSSGALVPAGVVVRFSSVVKPATTINETLVEPLNASSFATFASATTDQAGRASVLVRLGTAAGTARLVASVPQFGFIDTIPFTALPGAASRVSIAPADTTVSAGASFTYHGGVTDQFGNTRTDALSWSVSSGGVSVSTAAALVASATGRYTVTATAGIGKATAAVSVVPRGRLAAIRSSSNIVIMDLDGTHQKALTGALSDGGIGFRSAWTPDGSAVIFTSLSNSTEVLQIVDTLGVVNPILRTGIPGGSHVADPAFSANGAWLYFGAFDATCQFGYCIYRSKPDGSSPERVGSTTTASGQLRPSPSPDGSRVAYQSTSYSGPIRVFDVATKAPLAWSASGTFPAWSPDGTQIAFINLSGQLSLIKPDGTGLRTPTLSISNRTYSSAGLAWTSDSRYVLARSSAGVLDLVDVTDGTVLPLPYSTALSYAVIH